MGVKGMGEVDRFYLTTSKIFTDLISAAASPVNTGLCSRASRWVGYMAASGAKSLCVSPWQQWLIEWVAWLKRRTAELAPFTLDGWCALYLEQRRSSVSKLFHWDGRFSRESLSDRRAVVAATAASWAPWLLGYGEGLWEFLKGAVSGVRTETNPFEHKTIY